MNGELSQEEREQLLKELQPLIQESLYRSRTVSRTPKQERQAILRRLPGPLRRVAQAATVTPMDIPGARELTGRLPAPLRAVTRTGLEMLTPLAPTGLLAPVGAAASLALRHPQAVRRTWDVLTVSPMSHPTVREAVERLPGPTRQLAGAALSGLNPLSALIAVGTVGMGSGGAITLQSLARLAMAEAGATALGAAGQVAGGAAGRRAAGAPGQVAGQITGGILGAALGARPFLSQRAAQSLSQAAQQAASQGPTPSRVTSRLAGIGDEEARSYLLRLVEERPRQVASIAQDLLTAHERRNWQAILSQARRIPLLEGAIDYVAPQERACGAFPPIGGGHVHPGAEGKARG